jgi:hypothetical protein
VEAIISSLPSAASAPCLPAGGTSHRRCAAPRAQPHTHTHTHTHTPAAAEHCCCCCCYCPQEDPAIVAALRNLPVHNLSVEQYPTGASVWAKLDGDKTAKEEAKVGGRERKEG